MKDSLHSESNYVYLVGRKVWFLRSFEISESPSISDMQVTIQQFPQAFPQD